MTIESNRRTYPGLDIIRLGAALIVANFHFGWYYWRYDPDRQIAWLTPLASWGWVGVPIFFVISGFVISFSAEGRNAKDFAVSRAARLYPASWICATLILAVQPTPLWVYARTMILSPIGPWVSGAYWTLAIEIIFYALVAVALWRKWDLAKLALCLGFYSSAFWLLRGVNSFVGRPVNFDAIENYNGYLLLAHDGVLFAFGMLLQQKRYPIAAAIFLMSGFVAVATRSHALALPGGFVVAPLIWLAAVGLIVFSAFRNDFVRRWTRRVPTRTIGLMTYPLYLIHGEVGHRIMLGIWQGQLVAYAVAMAATFFLALTMLPLEALLRKAVFYPRRRIRIATQS